MNINYKSDFAILVNLESDYLEMPWRVVFKSRKDAQSLPTGEYIVYFDGTNYHSSRRVTGEEEYNMVLELIDHQLPAGELVAEWTTLLDNDLFTSGQQRVVAPYIAPVTLVEGASDDSADPLLMPYIAPIVVAESDDTGEATTLSNDTVTINEDGIYIAPSPILGNNNVFGGILAYIEVDEEYNIGNTWFHPDVGEYAYVTMYEWSVGGCTLKLYNGIWGYGAEEYAVIGSTWQGSYDAVGGGAISVSMKDNTSFTFAGVAPSGLKFYGGFLIVFSTRHIWY